MLLQGSDCGESVPHSPRREWIWSRASSAYYFANEYNTASIRMHKALGFLAVARFAEIHRVTADDGRSELILFEASR
ncbi:hypothetical protein GCM10023063_22150 [Arthrobacter methylotrophus]